MGYNLIMFTKDDAQNVQDAIQGAKLVRVNYANLGGDDRASLMFLICFDPKETWINGYLENSRYIRMSLQKDTGKLEQFSGGRGMKKFRKRTVKSLEQAIEKINAHIAEVA